MFKFDPEKALEVILYIAKKAPIPDIYHVLKILYFADLMHLERYGRFICGDHYIAMKDGPVPSGSYDIIKSARDPENAWNRYEPALSAIKVLPKPDYSVIPQREPNLEYLSESDIECLDEAIKKYGRMPFGKLKDVSHDEAHEKADLNGEIDIEDIARMLKDGDLLVEYIRG